MARKKRTKEGALTERVAISLLGAGATVDESKVRFGQITVNLQTGRFFDEEDERGGTYLDLIRHVKPDLENGQAEAWFDEHVKRAPIEIPEEFNPERTLLGLLAMRPELVAAIDDAIVPDDFQIIHRQMIEVILAADGPVQMKALIDACGGDGLMPVPGCNGINVNAYVAKMLAEAPNPPDGAHFARALAALIRSRANREGDVDDGYNVEEPPPPFVPTMGLRMWADQDQPGPQYDYLVEDLIPQRQLVVLMGETGTGKSFLTFAMAMALARGVPFMRRRILKSVGVVWCAYEAAEGATARMRAYRRHHGLALEHLPFAALQHPLPLWPNEENGGKLIAEVDGIQRNYFGGIPLGAIVVDTYNAATPGASEIDSEVVSKIRTYFKRVVDQTGATLLIVGHTNASGKHRGNEQLTNNVDTIIKVSMKKLLVGRDPVQVKDEDGRDVRVMEVTKQREGKNGDKFEFVLQQVKDGTINGFGAERTSCVIVPHDGPADNQGRATVQPKGPRLSHERTVILHALRAALGAHGEPPPTALRLPRSITTVVNAKKWKLEYMARLPDNDQPNDAAINKRMYNASSQLQNLAIIGRHNPFVWLAKDVDDED